MLGFNWVDVIIIGLLALAAYQGMRIGFVTQVFAVSAFVAALFAGGWLYPHLLSLHDQTLRSAINATLVLLTATYAGIRGLSLGQNIHWSFRLGKWRPYRKSRLAEKYAGSLPALIGSLLLVWLLGVGISRLPFEDFSNSVSSSFIVQQLVRALPPVPSVFAEFNEEIDPNSQPAIAAQPKPYKDFNYSPQEVEAAADQAADSVVRITSFGCGGLVSGSGFAVGHGLIATNAHIIAGVKRPIIKYKNHSYEATPVVFSPAFDYAVLRADHLPAQPAKLLKNDPGPGTTVAVLGYPGGNYQTAAGILRDDLNVDGSNIYGTGNFKRQAYGVQALTAEGSSGGPVATRDGVVSMVFSKATDRSDYAYTLPASYLINALSKLQPDQPRVGTGACTP
jgi:S1-C subfamily serine protease